MIGDARGVGASADGDSCEAAWCGVRVEVGMSRQEGHDCGFG